MLIFHKAKPYRLSSRGLLDSVGFCDFSPAVILFWPVVQLKDKGKIGRCAAW